MSVRLFARAGTPVRPAALRRCLEALMRKEGLGGAELEISLVGERRIRSLNREHRRKDAVTDVLSFPIEAKAPKGGRPWCLGEIVIATPVAARQARRARRTLTQQALRLAVHGLVHLQGHDHELGPRAAKRFEALEARYLNYLSRKGLMPWDGSLRL